MKRALFTSLVLLLGLLIIRPDGMIFWVENAFASDDRESLLPKLIYPKDAEHCVEPTEIMRRNHMDFLLHQRDETVLNGVRSKKYSLVECLDCHNPRAEKAPVVRYENPEHFCAGCHQYASVDIDCFECHSDQGKSHSSSSLEQAYKHAGQDWKLSSIKHLSTRLKQASHNPGHPDVR
ncbi:MAG: cytochrome c3 family protein [Pseudomonadota bacterium]